MLYEITCVATEGKIYDEAFKLHNIQAFLKAFPERQDLERYLGLRTVYFPLILLHIKSVVFAEPSEESELDLNIARSILTLAARLARQDAVNNDLTALEQYLHLDTSPNNKDLAAAGVQEAWAGIVQRAAESEVGKLTPRSHAQWNQIEHTHFMTVRGKPIDDVRKLFQAECGGGDPSDKATGATKDVLARKIAQARINNEKPKESQILSSLTDMADQVAAKIKQISGHEDQCVVELEKSPLQASGLRQLSTGLADICASTGFAVTDQVQILEKCSSLTAHVMQKADKGIEHLVFKRTDKAPMQAQDKLKNLDALAPGDHTADHELCLHLRGSIVPSTSTSTISSTSVVVPEVATFTCNNRTVSCSLVVHREQSQMTPWAGNSFVPALLIKADKPQQKDTEPGKRKNRSASAERNDALALSLNLKESFEEVSVSSSETIRLKMLSLTGMLPPSPEVDSSVADRLVTLSGPSLKRGRADADVENISSKRFKAAASLLTSSANSPEKSQSTVATDAGADTVAASVAAAAKADTETVPDAAAASAEAYN